MRESSNDEALHRMLLKHEIEGFLFREGRLLDDRHFEEWLDLLADDIRYWAPLRKNVPLGELERENTRKSQEIGWFDEGKETLRKRVAQIRTGTHWAEEPLSRVRHLISNVQVLEAVPSAAQPAQVTAESCFLVYRNRQEVETDVFVGKRRDLLRKENGSWKIAEREIILDQNVLLAKNLTVFF